MITFRIHKQIFIIEMENMEIVATTADNLQHPENKIKADFSRLHEHILNLLLQR